MLWILLSCNNSFHWSLFFLFKNSCLSQLYIQPLLKALTTYYESVITVILQLCFNNFNAFITAKSSVLLLVVFASPPLIIFSILPNLSMDAQPHWSRVIQTRSISIDLHFSHNTLIPPTYFNLKIKIWSQSITTTIVYYTL